MPPPSRRHPLSVDPLRPSYRWELLGLLCLAFFFHQGDRAIYGVVLSGIRAELGLSEAQLGLVGSVLFLTLALMMPIAGIVGDRLPKHRIIILSLVFWSAATLLTGYSQGLTSLVLLRSVATAGGEAFYAPAAFPLMAKFHPRSRALALSLHQSALYVGVMTSGFLGGWLAQRWGWRSAFYAFGGAGIALGAVFALRLRDTPERAPAGPRRDSGILDSLGLVFRVPTALLLTVGLTAVVFVNNAFLVWAPEFLREKGVQSLALAGGYAMTWHHLPALVAISIGGSLTDRWSVRRPSARIELQAAAMTLAAPGIVLMALAPDLATACAGLAVFGFFRGLYESNTQAALFDVIEPARRGSAVGVTIMIAFLAGSVSPWLLGRSRELLGPGRGLAYGFAALAAAYVVGAAALAAARALFFERDRLRAAGAAADQY